MYPINVNVSNKKVLLVGGGKIAARKIKGLLSEKALVTVIGPTLHETIEEEEITWIAREYQSGDIKGDESLIFACTDNKQLNEQIQSEAKASQLVNVVSNKKTSDFYNMSMLKHEGIHIGISTEGVSPILAKQTRIDLEKWLKMDKE